MREAAAAERFETKTDLIVDAHGDHRRGAIGRDDHAKPVGEGGVFHRDMQVLHFDFLLDFPSTRFRFRKVATVAFRKHAC